MSLLCEKFDGGATVRLGKALPDHLPETAENLRKDSAKFLLESVKTCQGMKSEGLLEFIESRLKDNSIVLLGECVSKQCDLNRVLGGGIRTGFQSHLVKVMTTTEFATGTLIYTIF